MGRVFIITMIEFTDICIQIGNTDNKLTQQEWSKFISAMTGIVEGFGIIHFAGGSSAEKPFQNYCICASEVRAEHLAELLNLLSKRRGAYYQDSIAVLTGNTKFI